MKIAFWEGETLVDDESPSSRLCRELAILGHEVEHYARFGTRFKALDEEMRAGVRQVPSRMVLDPGQISVDAFISVGDVEALMTQPQAKATVLWVRSATVTRDDLAMLRMRKFGKIACPSRWGASAFTALYPQVQDSKLLIIPDGLDPSHLPHDSVEDLLAQKNGVTWFTYSAPPDNGLDKLIELWPLIRRMAPEAELHVHADFADWKRRAGYDQKLQARIVAVEDEMEDLGEHGVIRFVDDVGWPIVADSLRRSIMWLYPTDAREVTCPGIMDAQASCVVPVTTQIAALPELAEHGVFIKPFNNESVYARSFLTNVQALLHDKEARDKIAVLGRSCVEKRSWAASAAQWQEALAGLTRTGRL